MKMIKITLVVLLVLGTLFALAQVYFKKEIKDIEMYSYSVVKSFDNFEIREYESANFAYVTMAKGTYDETSSNGFRQLAGYIFGGNEAEQKIAMTSPVQMNMEDSMTMMFMVPAQYKLEDLPTPNNANVKFKTEPKKTMAAIQFGGWADDKKIEKYKLELEKLLSENGIEHKGNFSFLGYNAPFEVTNRRNEVVVEVR